MEFGKSSTKYIMKEFYFYGDITFLRQKRKLHNQKGNENCVSTLINNAIDHKITHEYIIQTMM